MESVGSNSPTPAPRLYRRRRRPPTGPQQAFADRVGRALHHRLLLLHRSDPATFFVLGATANVYAVTLSPVPSCTCPDRAASPCKHVLFVLIRALGVGPTDPCLRRHRSALRPCHLARLLATPTLPESLAGPTLRRRFRQLFLRPAPTPPPPAEAGPADGGRCCPVCLEEMAAAGKKVVACGTCRNVVHEECLLRWKRSGGRRPATCVLCRALWRERPGPADAGNYLNLAAYLDQEEINGSDGDDNGNGNRNQNGGNVDDYEEDVCGV